MILNTKRLILREWNESDAKDLYSYAKQNKWNVNKLASPRKM